MHVSAFKQSKYLTRADVGTGVLATIKELFQENISKDGAPEELKWCMAFAELEKPLIVNATNAAIIAQITKSEETDDWIGNKVVLFDDPNISFGGKLVGGIRVRAPRGQAAKATPVQPKLTPATRPAPAKPDPYDAQPEAPEDLQDTPF